MACDIFDIFRVMEENLSTELMHQATWEGLFTPMFQRSTYPRGTGLNQRTFTMANSHPTSVDEAWLPVTQISGNTEATGEGACAAVYNQVYVGWEEDGYAPETYSLKGLPLCREEMPYNFNEERFLSSFLLNMKRMTTETYESRLESINRQLTPKYIITGAGQEDYRKIDTKGRLYPGTAGLLPGSVEILPAETGLTGKGVIKGLNADHLDSIAEALTRDGAAQPDSNGFLSYGDSGPIYTLYIHTLQSKKIVFDQTNGMRLDLEHAGSSELMRRIGATRYIRNWRHVPNMFPARYGFGQAVVNSVTNSTTKVTGPAGSFDTVAAGMPVTGSGIPASTTVAARVSATEITLSAAATASATVTLTFGTVGKLYRVETFTRTVITAGKGYKSTTTAAWKTAPIEEATIMFPRVAVIEVVQPVNSVAGVSWSPITHNGEWKWVTGRYKWEVGCIDPLENHGVHFGTFTQAPRPEMPQYGGTILYNRFL